MSTRGYLGIKKGKKLKGQYNHFDSYPSGLGFDIVNSINKINKNDRLKVLNETFDYIELVDEGSTPTKEQKEKCILAGVINLAVSEKSLDDWYCILRGTQGNLDLYINKAIPYMINGNDFLNDSLFCEWSYIINLNTNKLEVYENGKNDLRGKFDLLDLSIDDLASL